MSTLIKSTLDQEHKNLGAKLVDFAGFSMPIQYTSILEEHHCVRKAAGLFDVSHMGIVQISGQDAAEALDYLCSKKASKLEEGQALYTLICNEQGGCVDDIIIYRLKENSFKAILNASNIDKDIKHIKKHSSKYAVEIKRETESDLIALQGPKSFALLESLGIKTQTWSKFRIYKSALKNFDLSFCTTGYTGEQGVEIIVPKDQSIALWQLLLNEGKKFGLQACGLGARDTLRLEMGYSLYGHEINEDINPFEAGLGWAVDLENPSFARDKLQEHKEKKERKLICIQSPNRRAPRQQMPVFDSNKNECGYITSGSFAPSLGYGIGMALVNNSVQEPFFLRFAKNDMEFKKCTRPFYKIAKENL